MPDQPAPYVQTRQPDGWTYLVRPCLAEAKTLLPPLLGYPHCCTSGPAPPVCRVKVPKNYLNAPGAFAADLAYKSKFFYYTTRSLKSIPLRSRKSHRNLRVICCFYGQTVHYIIFLSRSEPCIFSVLYHKNDIDQKNVKPFSQEIRDVRFFIICDMCSKAYIFKLTLLVESANISVASWQSSCKIE